MDLPARAMCGRCRRPVRVCYCPALPQLTTTTRVVILQHPRERGMPIGTAHMARLCLPGAELRVGVRWDALGDLGPSPILLYPGPGARDLGREPPAGPVTLVAIDGTWSQAKNVVRDNPALQALPRYAFDPPEPSQYRIRREPRAECVSTIEALMYALGALEGDAARFQAMLDPLRAMVDAQLACHATGPSRYSAQRRPRPARPRVLPQALHAELVCVSAEANAWPYRGPTAEEPELVHWVAERVSTGERFDLACVPERPLAPSTTHHAELTEARLLAGVTRAELMRRFGEFLRPGDVICAWGYHGLRLYLDGGGALPAPALDLRAAAKALVRGKVGSLEAYAASLGPAPAPAGQGRAGRRLAMLVQVVEAWRRL